MESNRMYSSFVHSAYCLWNSPIMLHVQVVHSFWLLSSITLYEYIKFLIHLPTDRFFFLQSWAIMKRAATNILIQVFEWIYSFVSLGYIPRREMIKPFPKWFYNFTFYSQQFLRALVASHPPLNIFPHQLFKIYFSH